LGLKFAVTSVLGLPLYSAQILWILNKRYGSEYFLNTFTSCETYTIDLSLFVINLRLSNQGKVLPLLLSRMKIKFCMSLTITKMLVLSAKCVSLMLRSLFVFLSASLTYINPLALEMDF
jgi:hypothetical protein